jgi:hypothetical protein
MSSDGEQSRLSAKDAADCGWLSSVRRIYHTLSAARATTEVELAAAAGAYLLALRAVQDNRQQLLALVEGEIASVELLVRLPYGDRDDLDTILCIPGKEERLRAIKAYQNEMDRTVRDIASQPEYDERRMQCYRRLELVRLALALEGE